MTRGLLGLLLAASLLWPLAAHAQKSILVETEKTATPNGKPAYSLLINGEVVARLAKPTVIGGVERTPQHGIALAAALLTEAYRSGKAKFAIVSDADGRNFTLQVNGKPLLVASDLEGKAWGATPGELAASWQRNITTAMEGAATISVASNPAAPEPKPLPPPEPTQAAAASGPTVTQDGALLNDDPPAAKPAQPKPAQQPAPKNNTAQTPKNNAPPAPAPAPPTQPAAAEIGGLEVHTGMKAYDPPTAQSVPPMDVPAQYTAIVTGNSPSATMLKTSVDAAIRSAAGLPDTATILWRPADDKFSLPPLTPGTRLSLPAVYKVNADTNLTPVTLTLENLVIPTARETVTFFSNTPENVTQEQLLYYADLPPGQASRLVFHHQNQSRGQLRFVARVVNTSGTPAALHVTPGITAPNLNTFLVGFKSAESFWQNLSSDSGYVLRVPAGGQAWIVGQDLDPGYTASGYYRLSNLSDNPLRIETLALSPDTVVPKGEWPEREGASCGVFPQPYITTKHEYLANADSPWLYLRIGDDSPASQTDDSVHYGCYGVTHTYEVTVRNTKATPALVFIVLRGSAGEVKGQFYIDDEYVATPLVEGGEEQLLKELPLPPNATKKVRIKAIALNGSFYPASIIFREERITIKY